MNRNTVLAVVALVALAVAGAVALLSAEGSGAGGATPAVAKRAGGAGSLPAFSADMAASERAPQTLQAQPAVEMTTGEPGAAASGPVQGSVPVRVVSGRIVRASDGTPIAEVSVSLGGLRRMEPSDTTGQVTQRQDVIVASGHDPPPEPTDLVFETTGPDGSFSLRVPDCASSLSLSNDRVTQSAELPPGTQTLTALEIVFDSGFRIGGRVLDEAGQPLPGAHVDVDRHREAVADDAGRFVVKDVVPDQGETVVNLRATAPDCVQAISQVIAPRDVTEMPLVDLRLAGSGRLAGRVTHTDGSVAANVEVSVGFRMGRGTDSEAAKDLIASTDGDGEWDIDHVPAGTYLVRAGGRSTAITLQVSQMAFAMPGGSPDSGLAHAQPLPEAWVQDVVATTGATTRVDIVLPSGALLAGRVLDPSGAPLPGARVVLERVARWPAPEAQGNSTTSSDGYYLTTRSDDGKGETVLRREDGRHTTDEHGHFEFGDLGAGEWRLLASLPGGAFAPTERTVALRGDESLTAFDLLLGTGIVLRSRITDPAGQPLEGAVILLKDAPSNTFRKDDFAGKSGKDGWFEVSGVTPARKAIAISLSGYSWVFTEIDPAAPPPVFVLQSAPSLRGEVVDALTGEPVEAYGLKVARGDGWSESDTQSRPGGTFHEEQGDDLACDVTVSAPGYEPLTIKDVVPSTTAQKPLRFRLVHQN